MLLTAGERVLLHLLNFWNAKEPPPAITQQGISEATRLRRSHVPRTVKALAREGYVEERMGRVQGRGRKVKLYAITESGLRRARELATALEGQAIVAEGASTTVGEFVAASGRTLLDVAMDLDASGRYVGRAKEVESPTFLDRKEELALLASWLPGPASAMVVYGRLGMGKTALARRFLHRSAKVQWWRALETGDSAASLLSDLSEFLVDRQRGRLAAALASGGNPWKAVAEDLGGLDVVLVLDDYGNVHEDVVDFAHRLLAVLEGTSGAKVLVLAEEATPSYCRFYDRRAVEDGRVQELHLRGLGPEESKELLGRPRIADEAFRRIHLLTKGCPLYLELLRAGDAGTLKSRSRFTTAEINLLMFSRDVES